MESVTSKKRQFTIIVRQEERGYSGQCLEIPGVISQGESLDELKGNIAEALHLTLDFLMDEAKKEDGKLVSISI